MKKLVPLTVILILLGVWGTAHALDPMRIRIRTALPPEIHTIGEAARYYADVIGYRLTTAYPAPEESAQIASEPISPLSLTDRVLPVEETILAILPEPYRLVIDPEHRRFAFEKGGVP